MSKWMASPRPILSRRILLGSGAAILGSQSLAYEVRAQAGPLGQAAVTPFMQLSTLLIAHRLDPVIGARIAAGLKADQRPLARQIDLLIKLARSRSATQVEDFFPFADDTAKAAALRIVSAWYLGVIDNVPGATVFAYELALMFQVTSDVMAIPTYAISGPNGWGAQAPPLEAMPIF